VLFLSVGKATCVVRIACLKAVSGRCFFIVK
jgi:hypothetical protein